MPAKVPGTSLIASYKREITSGDDLSDQLGNPTIPVGHNESSRVTAPGGDIKARHRTIKRPSPALKASYMLCITSSSDNVETHFAS